MPTLTSAITAGRVQLGRSQRENVVVCVVRKQVHRVESRMEYYWELRSKNAQNIKTLMCPLYMRTAHSRSVATLFNSIESWWSSSQIVEQKKQHPV